jgi:hypothetical protein
MSRNDVIELIGIVCVLLAAAVVVYGISLVSTAAALIMAGTFLLVIGMLCIGIAHQPNRGDV